MANIATVLYMDCYDYMLNKYFIDSLEYILMPICFIEQAQNNDRSLTLNLKINIRSIKAYFCSFSSTSLLS